MYGANQNTEKMDEVSTASTTVSRGFSASSAPLLSARSRADQSHIPLSDLAHRNKRGETTGIPVVTTVPPAQQHFVQNPHYIHGPQHGSGSVEMQPASSARQGETSYSVIGTPLYITR